MKRVSRRSAESRGFSLGIPVSSHRLDREVVLMFARNSIQNCLLVCAINSVFDFSLVNQPKSTLHD